MPSPIIAKWIMTLSKPLRPAVVALALASIMPFDVALAASPTPAKGPAGQIGPAAKSPPATPLDSKDAGTGEKGALDPTKEAAGTDEASTSRNAARTRMRECGHQWSTMKKNGNASGLTFKEFSQGCLARK